MRELTVLIVLLMIVYTLGSPVVRTRKGTKNDVPLVDDLVRNKLFPLAAGAYSDRPEDCLRKKFSNGTIQMKIKRLCGDGYQEPENCFGYTALLHEDKTIVLAFRGTNGFIQLIYEIDRTAFKDKINTTAGGQVSNYFFSVYSTIMDNGGLRDNFLSLIKKYPSYKVWVTGHSLGGALASIAASEMIARGEVDASRVQLYTFGQPRTGDVDFAAAHDKIVPTSYRIIHQDDIVPHMPCEKCEGYYHHKSEIWYNNKMKAGDTFSECDDDESDTCSDGALWKYSVMDHLYYYGFFVTGYGFNGCA